MIAQLAALLPTARPTPVTEAAILRALAGGQVLRQYEIAARIGLTEHHNWSTHAALNAMVQNGTVRVSHLHILCRHGKVSKRAYRHFYLTPQPQPMRRRDILREWVGALGLRF